MPSGLSYRRAPHGGLPSGTRDRLASIMEEHDLLCCSAVMLFCSKASLCCCAAVMVCCSCCAATVPSLEGQSTLTHGGQALVSPHVDKAHVVPVGAASMLKI